jgi:hypothetical protein
MQGCNLPYIPKHLHLGEKPKITEYAIGDIIFRRCTPDEIENPFKTVSITELSHNIGISKGESISDVKDVLFNIREDEPDEEYVGQLVCKLKIKSLDDMGQYAKEFRQRKGAVEFVGKVKLLHDPLPCMYPHCLLRVWINGEIVTFRNYNHSLKKLNQIRTSIRHELATMIFREAIEQYPS